MSLNADLHTLAAIASNLARGQDMKSAVCLAIQYVAAGIQSAPDLGQGNGPINHLHWTRFEPSFGEVTKLGTEIQTDRYEERMEVELLSFES